MSSKIIWVKCSCDSYYKLINKINNLNIDILQTKLANNELKIKICLQDYDKLKKYLISYDFKKERNTGLLNILDIIRQHLIFFISCIIGIIIFIIINHLIIEIDIIHENSEIRTLLKDELEERNIRVLSLKKSYKELNEIRQSILDKYPDKLDWMEIQTIGMKYIIHVEERLINDEKTKNDFCNVYAQESGIVNRIQIKKGVAVVSQGDYVNIGDLLITGEVNYNDQIKDMVCADGIVYAQKWYQVSINMPLKYLEKNITGKKRKNLIFENGQTKRRILKSRFAEFESQKSPIFDLFGYKLFLETQFELQKEEKYYTEDQAIDRGLQLAEEKMANKLNDGEIIIDKKVLKKRKNNSTIEIVVFVVTDEIIS